MLSDYEATSVLYLAELERAVLGGKLYVWDMDIPIKDVSLLVAQMGAICYGNAGKNKEELLEKLYFHVRSDKCMIQDCEKNIIIEELRKSI